MKSTLLVALSLAVVEGKMHLYFNNRFMEFGFDHTQRCYTISHCWDDHSKDSKWSGIPNPGQIVWFEDRYCAGDSIARASSKGSVNFEGTKLYNNVSSFRVQQDGVYPTDGKSSSVNTTATLHFELDEDAHVFAYNGSLAA